MLYVAQPPRRAVPEGRDVVGVDIGLNPLATAAWGQQHAVTWRLAEPAVPAGESAEVRALAEILTYAAARAALEDLMVQVLPQAGTLVLETIGYARFRGDFTVAARRRAVADWHQSWGPQRAYARGIRVVRVPAAFTSQTCSQCRVYTLGTRQGADVHMSPGACSERPRQRGTESGAPLLGAAGPRPAPARACGSPRAMTVMNQEGKACCPPSLHRLGHLHATLPAELLALRTWLPWLALPRGNGRTGKVPALPKAGTLRPIDCRGAGVTLEEAHDLARRHGAGGIGIVLAPEMGLAALDLDAPLTLAAQVLLRDIAGYAERSPGGGVHVWLSGSLPRNRRQLGIEMLGSGFVTVTGAALGGRGRTLGTLGTVLEQLDVAPPDSPRAAAPILADREVFQRLYTAANGARAQALLENGDWAGAGYPSASEADLAAARMLRFYCSDPEQLRRLMQGTALRRGKWDQGDYLERTIRCALELGGPVWRGPAT